MLLIRLATANVSVCVVVVCMCVFTGQREDF